MCDYSLQHAKSRPAAVGDRLTVKSFGMGTFGFACQDDPAVVVCVLPGTELVFDDNVKLYSFDYVREYAILPHRTAVFRQIDMDRPFCHHDAIEFPDGVQILLNFLAQDQVATVLQLPAAPMSEAEAQHQSRLEVVG
jgi:hypothetical protein